MLYTINERIKGLRDELLSTKAPLCMQRAEYVTKAYQQTEGQHDAIRRARALEATLDHIHIFTRKNELLVGQRSELLCGRSLAPEYRLEGNGYDINQVPEWIRSYWEGRKIRDLTLLRNPKCLLDAEAELACGYPMGEYNSFGHVIVDYPKVLTKGLCGILQETEKRLEGVSAVSDPEGYHFLHAIIISLKAVIRWANR